MTAGHPVASPLFSYTVIHTKHVVCSTTELFFRQDAGKLGKVSEEKFAELIKSLRAANLTKKTERAIRLGASMNHASILRCLCPPGCLVSTLPLLPRGLLPPPYTFLSFLMFAQAWTRLAETWCTSMTTLTG